LLKKYESQLDASGIDMLQRISRASNKMDHMIEDLLRLSGISRKQIEVHPVDLSAIATSVISELREADPDRTVAVYIREGIVAQADPPLIEIAISNLLRNAWKFTANRGDACIEFDTEEQNGSVIYQVRDNGAGFNRKMAAQMFMPFYRLHSDKQFSGTGIGLAIVERVLHRHGGKVWADGEPEKGAVFSFTLGV
jgi:light-regulated signal transduction histidine kinase (bacteriophytochrome)